MSGLSRCQIDKGERYFREAVELTNQRNKTREVWKCPLATTGKQKEITRLWFGSARLKMSEQMRIKYDIFWLYYCQWKSYVCEYHIYRGQVWIHDYMPRKQ